MKATEPDGPTKRRSKGQRTKGAPGPAKQRRIDAQRQREETNRRLRASGLPTAWEEARADRKARRARMRAEGTLVQQKRINGKVAKTDANGNLILVECCPNCTRHIVAVTTPDLPDKEKRERTKASTVKMKQAKTRKAPRQITPKEN